MIIFIFVVLLIVLFALPFLPGLRGYWQETDAEPLYINLNYQKDPRYFGISFRETLAKSLRGHEGVHGIRLIVLSRQELAEVVATAMITEGRIIPHLYCVDQDLASGSKVLFEKEVYVKGSACIGEGNQLRALACDGNVHIRQGTKFIRWVDAEGSIRAEQHSDLGISASCGKELSLDQYCSFKRLYGFPIRTGPIQSGDMEGKQAFLEMAAAHLAGRGDKPRVERNLSKISAHTLLRGNIITAHNLEVGEGATIYGHIKTHGDFIAAQRMIVYGNVFAEGDIYLGPYCRVWGVVFAQGSITCAEGVIIGAPDRIKSVISKKGIGLQNGVTIYGYVSTEGEGRVL